MESRSFSTRFVPRLYQTRFRLAGGSLASIRAGLPPAEPLFSAINGIFDIVFALLACYTRQCASLLGIAGEAALVGLPPWVLLSAPYLAKSAKTAALPRCDHRDNRRSRPFRQQRKQAQEQRGAAI